MEATSMLCPVCGSDMDELSPNVWTCKCGHRKIVQPFTKKEPSADEEPREELRKRFWEERKGGVKKTTSHKKELMERRKRTST